MKGKIGIIIVLALIAMILIGCQPAKMTANDSVQQDAQTSPSSTGSQPDAQTSPSSAGSQPPASDAQTSPPSTGSQPDAKSSSSGASPSTVSQPDARSEFLDLMGKNPTVKVEFKTSGSASLTDETGTTTTQDFAGKMITYTMDGDGRTDIISDGQSMHFYDTATRKESCSDGECTPTAEDTPQDAAYNKAETVDGKPAAVTKLPGRSFAGIKASCYKVVVEQYFYYNSCFADDGTVLYNEVVDQKEGEQSNYIAEAISVTKDFPASVFEEK